MRQIGREYTLTVTANTPYSTYECPRCLGVYSISVHKAKKMEVCEKCSRKERDRANILARKQSKISGTSGQ